MISGHVPGGGRLGAFRLSNEDFPGLSDEDFPGALAAESRARPPAGLGAVAQDADEEESNCDHQLAS